MCPDSISGNRRNRISFLCGRLQGAVFKLYLNATDIENADWQSVEYEEAVKGNKTQQREETTNAALTRGAPDKEQSHTDKGCRYVIVLCHQVRG